jgi:hypothetical protein
MYRTSVSCRSKKSKQQLGCEMQETPTNEQLAEHYRLLVRKLDGVIETIETRSQAFKALQANEW